LIEAAARLLVEEGPAALTARRLTGEVGTSTIAVYTYFDGMDDVRRAVAVEGFTRLAQQLAAVPRTDDPVADVAAMGMAYLTYGVTNPDVYRFTFQQQSEDLGTDADAFAQLLEGVQRAVDSGRFTQVTAAIALQLWVTTHGLTSLHLAGLLTLAETLATLSAMGPALFVGFGDTPQAAQASVSAAAAAAASAFPASTPPTRRGSGA
jgi:AcrR family transcriptional regulator